MKRLAYFYRILLLGIFALIVYDFLNYLWVMISLIAFSSVFSFVVFLIQTKTKPSIENKNHQEEPIDFYKTNSRTSYYITEQRKQVNAD